MKYKVIYIDPPWGCYRDKANAGKRGAGFKYPLMDLEEIKTLPLSKIADTDCALFCWGTFPLLPELLETIKSWNFQYKSIAFNWIKTNKKQTNTLFWGMGNFSRSNSEICVLATRGKPKVISHKIHSVIQSPIQAHSKKPDEARDRIVQLFGDVPRIELFARQIANGWDVLGGALNGKDIRDELKEMIQKKGW